MSTYTYLAQPYRRELDSIIKAVRPDGLVLEDTVFHPEGGGQPGDRGWINGQPVSDTRMIDGDLVHIMADVSGFSVGEAVSMSIDWQWRHHFMKAHTAEHMIAGCLYSLAGIGVLSIHLGEDALTIETDQASIPLEVLHRVEDAVNKAIHEDHVVRAYELSHEDALALGLRRPPKVDGLTRIVEVEGVDRIACGGVHVASTAEVGEVGFLSSEKIRSHVRTIWLYGEAATRRRHEERQLASDIGALLSAPFEGVHDAVERLVEESKAQKAALRAKDELLAQLALSLHGPVFESAVPVDAYVKLAGSRFFTVHVEDGHLRWLLSGSEDDFKRLKDLYGHFGMKGGGRTPLWQGSATCDADALLGAVRALLEEVE